MLRAAKISLTKAKENILLWAILNCICYIAFLLVVKYTGLLHITGLRVANYLFFIILSVFQVRQLIKRFNGYIPFLESFFISFFTGSFSFFLFAVFLLGYSFFDPYLNSLYVMDIENTPSLVPPLLVFFEGTGVSIVAGLIIMIYAEKFMQKGTRP